MREVGRRITGCYILFFWVFYNLYQLIAYQEGAHAFAFKDYAIFFLAICGSSLCFACRTGLYVLEAGKEKNHFLRLFMFLYQGTCGIVFFLLVAETAFFTKGRVDWHTMRLLLEYIYCMVMLVILQFAGYAVSCMMAALVKSREKEPDIQNRSVKFIFFVFCTLIALVGILLIGMDLYAGMSFELPYIAEIYGL